MDNLTLDKNVALADIFQIHSAPVFCSGNLAFFLFFFLYVCVAMKCYCCCCIMVLKNIEFQMEFDVCIGIIILQSLNIFSKILVILWFPFLCVVQELFSWILNASINLCLPSIYSMVFVISWIFHQQSEIFCSMKS